MDTMSLLFYCQKLIALKEGGIVLPANPRLVLYMNVVNKKWVQRFHLRDPMRYWCWDEMYVLSKQITWPFFSHWRIWMCRKFSNFSVSRRRSLRFESALKIWMKSWCLVQRQIINYYRRKFNIYCVSYNFWQKALGNNCICTLFISLVI